VIRRRIVVTGRVQGVPYRAWFVREAQALGLDGWVRNRADGSVEAVVAGPADLVERAIAVSRQGSPASRVAAVAVHDDAPAEALDGFAQRPTL
jgi:acylphosphatase